MGRYRSMPSGHGVAQSPSVARAAAHAVLADRPWRPDVAEETRGLYRELISRMPDLPIKDIDQVGRIAAAMVTTVPGHTLESQRRRMVLLCDLLDYDRELNGDLDLRRALRHGTVESFLRYQAGTQSRATVRTYASHLRPFGRLLHPQEYPPRQPTAREARVQAPLTDDEVKALYRKRLSVSEMLACRLETALDLTTGAGARSEEMTDLTGSCVRTLPTTFGDAVCVDLTSRRTGLIRTVPFLDPVKGARVLRRAQQVGPDAYLLPGARRNAVNSVQTAIRKHGVDLTLPAVQLRHWWICDVARKPIPTAAFLQVADLGDSHTLFELAKAIPAYDPTTASQWFAAVIA